MQHVTDVLDIRASVTFPQAKECGRYVESRKVEASIHVITAAEGRGYAQIIILVLDDNTVYCS